MRTKGKRTGALPCALGRRGIPDVGQNTAVGEGHQHLRRLVVGGVAAEIAAGRQLDSLSSSRSAADIELTSTSTPRSSAKEDLWLLNRRTRLFAVADQREVRRAAVHLELPAVRQPPGLRPTSDSGSPCAMGAVAATHTRSRRSAPSNNPYACRQKPSPFLLYSCSI